MKHIIGSVSEQPLPAKDSRPPIVVVGLLAMVAVAVVWGVLVAPKAGRRLDDPLRLALEVALFGLAGAGLVAAGYPAAGIALFAVGVVAARAVRRVAPGS